jgi:hypothetical protein
MPWILPQLEHLPQPLMEGKNVRSVCSAARARMLGAGSWPSMVLSRATTANHHPVLNLQIITGEATWDDVLKGRNSADEALQVAVLVDSANVNVNTASLCFPKCATPWFQTESCSWTWRLAAQPS